MNERIISTIFDEHSVFHWWQRRQWEILCRVCMMLFASHLIYVICLYLNTIEILKRRKMKKLFANYHRLSQISIYQLHKLVLCFYLNWSCQELFLCFLGLIKSTCKPQFGVIVHVKLLWWILFMVNDHNDEHRLKKAAKHYCRSHWHDVTLPKRKRNAVKTMSKINCSEPTSKRIDHRFAEFIFFGFFRMHNACRCIQLIESCDKQLCARLRLHSVQFQAHCSVVFHFIHSKWHLRTRTEPAVD